MSSDHWPTWARVLAALVIVAIAVGYALLHASMEEIL